MQTPKLENTIVYLIGLAGSGKLTVAQEIARRTGARVVDNHTINNPIFGLLELDGVTPLPAGVWGRVGEVRRAVLATIAELSPPHLSFVFTNDLVDGEEASVEGYRQVREVAERRRALFVPVRLLCDPEVLAQRIVSPGRRERMKAIDPDRIRERARSETVLRVDHPDALTLDTSDLPAAGAAERILAHLAARAAR